jgi:hypothetical protein
MRQLQYRYASPSIFYYVSRVPTRSYEKELNRGARPAFRLVTAQDASAGLHMILCVSGITWSEGGIGEDGLPLVPHPTLELTDGWYRLRTQVDEVLARIRQSRTQHCGKRNSSRAMARQAWLPAAPGYSDTSFALARRRDGTLSRTGCDQGMRTFVFVQGTHPDHYRHIGVPCRLYRVSQGQRWKSHA